MVSRHTSSFHSYHVHTQFLADTHDTLHTQTHLISYPLPYYMVCVVREEWSQALWSSFPCFSYHLAGPSSSLPACLQWQAPSTPVGRQLPHRTLQSSDRPLCTVGEAQHRWIIWRDSPHNSMRWTSEGPTGGSHHCILSSPPGHFQLRCRAPDSSPGFDYGSPGGHSCLDWAWCCSSGLHPYFRHTGLGSAQTHILQDQTSLSWFAGSDHAYTQRGQSPC